MLVANCCKAEKDYDAVCSYYWQTKETASTPEKSKLISMGVFFNSVKKINSVYVLHNNGYKCTLCLLSA